MSEPSRGFGRGPVGGSARRTVWRTRVGRGSCCRAVGAMGRDGRGLAAGELEVYGPPSRLGGLGQLERWAGLASGVGLTSDDIVGRVRQSCERVLHSPQQRLVALLTAHRCRWRGACERRVWAEVKQSAGTEHLICDKAGLLAKC